VRELALAHDVIFVGGGNTANLLAVWRVHGFDVILREAWERGVLLCPHYDAEDLRRPVYTQLARDGFPPGIALDDAAGAHYVGAELHEVVASTAYAVSAEGERRLDVRRL
jgi:peptidase E